MRMNGNDVIIQLMLLCLLESTWYVGTVIDDTDFGAILCLIFDFDCILLFKADLSSPS